MLFSLEDGRLEPADSRTRLPISGFVVKQPPGAGGENAIAGLTSGGGSAVFASGGATYRLKRCGQAFDGFPDQPFYSHAQVAVDGGSVEVSYKPLSGLMSLATALGELKMADLFRRNGLAPAVEPVAMLAITNLPGVDKSANAAAVLYRIDSDLRLDELVHLALSPVLAELFEEKAVTYNPDSGWWDANGAPMSSVLDAWPAPFERVRQLGVAAGGSYRQTHDAGFLRGKGSAWFGNEVVDAQGRLSVVDFDGGTGPATDFPATMNALLRSYENSLYCNESFWYMTDRKPSTLGLFGAAFVDGFREGYEGLASATVPPGTLDAIIADHLAVWPQVSRALQFPDARTPS